MNVEEEVVSKRRGGGVSEIINSMAKIQMVRRGNCYHSAGFWGNICGSSCRG